MPNREAGAEFIALMRRYVIDYTNRHDASITADIMEPEYELLMGDHVLRGRDGEYRLATARQFKQFPGLCLTVNEIHTNGERLVMRFTEHGASRSHAGQPCVWAGIGLYRWNGRRLVSNAVEQDYFSRREQIERRVANPVEPPQIAPWDARTEARDPAAEKLVAAWLMDGMPAANDDLAIDDFAPGAASPLLDQEELIINDLFSCGCVVAFHVLQRGRLREGCGFGDETGISAYLHMAGLVHVGDGHIRSGRIVRNRVDLARRLKARPGKMSPVAEGT